MQGGERGREHRPFELPVAASGRVDRSDAGEGGKPVGAGETVQVAARCGEELGPEQWSDARQAGDHRGEFVLVKPDLDELVQFVDLLMELDQLQCQVADYLCDRFLAGQTRVLPIRRVDGSISERLGAADLAATQRRCEPLAT